MGRFSDMKDKLANAKDAVHIKILEVQLEWGKPRKMKQDILTQLAKYAQQSGQPATVFEEGYCILMDERCQWVLKFQSIFNLSIKLGRSCHIPS